MIKSAIRCPNDIVMVFDERGEQVFEYQHQYDEVREKILKDAPPDTLFGFFLDFDTELRVVPRGEW